MTTPNTVTTKHEKFTPAAYHEACEEYSLATSKDARAKIVADRPDVLQTGVMNGRRLNDEFMPTLTVAKNRAEETTVGSVVITAGLLGGLGVAGYNIYKAGKWAYAWFKGP